QVTGALDGSGVLRVDVREREEVVIGAGLLGLERPETGDEARLVQELAAGRALEQRVTRGLEGGRVDRAGAAEGAGSHVAECLPGLLDLRVAELDLAGRPVVVGLGS